MPYVRQKRKPPKDATCDASTGTDWRGHDPIVIRCKEPATVELKGGLLFETWVCEKHAAALLAESARRAAQEEKRG